MPSRLTIRLTRLEARRAPRAAVAYTHPAPPSGWWEEVLRLLHGYGYLDETLRFWGWTEPEIAAVAASLEEMPTDASTP